MIFVGLCWTLSGKSLSFLNWEAQNRTQCSQRGLARAEREDHLSQPPGPALFNAPQMQAEAADEMHIELVHN